VRVFPARGPGAAYGRADRRALAAAHAAGIVHCDIKPENLMVRPDGFVKVSGLRGWRENLASIASSSVLPAGTLRYNVARAIAGRSANPGERHFFAGIVLYELQRERILLRAGPFSKRSKGLNENARFRRRR